MWDVEELWISCSKRLRDQVSEATWMAYFDAVTAVVVDDHSLVLTSPSSQVRDKLDGTYRGKIEAVVNDVAGRPLAIALLVRSPERAIEGNGGVSTSPLGTAGGAQTSRTTPISSGTQTSGGTQATPAGPDAASNETHDANGSSVTIATDNGVSRAAEGILNATYTFDAFVTGSSNGFAHAAARSVAETPASSYNPLLIYGDSGLGKTHLLHAIGNYRRENFPVSHIRYVSTETFMNEFVESIRNNTGLQFKRRYRACDVLLVDDIQFMENKEGLQEEFFHTFNSLHEANRQIVLTSDRHPRFIATLEDRLRSRFASGVITDIKPPDLETRIAILRKKAEGERPHVPDEVLELIATHVKENIRELEGALIRVSAFASLSREPLTIALAERVLSDILAADQPRQITPKLILEATAAMFGFTIDELCGTSRRRPLVNARQISMFVFREVTDFSYPAIAREFGGRDHTTVIHAVAKISQLMKERRQVYDQVTALIQEVRGGR